MEPRLLHSERIDEISKALCKAQGEMAAAKKGSTNPFYRTNYADLASVMEATRPALVKNEIAVSQLTDYTENGTPILITLLLHSSGQWLKSYFPMREPTNAKVMHDPQVTGKIMTYIRRYTYAAATGVTQEDDDGESIAKTIRKSTKKPN